MVEFKLTYPVEIDGVEVTSLKFRRATVNDFIIAKARTGCNEDDKEFDEKFGEQLAANLAQISVDNVGDVEYSVDVPRLVKFVSELMTGDAKADESKKNDRQVRIDLKYPITKNGESITFLTVKRPSYKQYREYRDSKSDEINKTLTLLSHTTGLDLDILKELELGNDYFLSKEYLTLFLGGANNKR